MCRLASAQFHMNGHTYTFTIASCRIGVLSIASSTARTTSATLDVSPDLPAARSIIFGDYAVAAGAYFMTGIVKISTAHTHTYTHISHRSRLLACVSLRGGGEPPVHLAVSTPSSLRIGLCSRGGVSLHGRLYVACDILVAGMHDGPPTLAGQHVCSVVPLLLHAHASHALRWVHSIFC